MIRRIIHIDEERCNGCGACASACHEGAIEMVNGKAKLAREHFCDGLGDCLPACPAGAITFEKREAPAYDEEAVKASQKQKEAAGNRPAVCPGSAATQFERAPEGAKENRGQTFASAGPAAPLQNAAGRPESQLMQWPVQIKLVPPQAPFYQGRDLLIAADCTAYAYAGMHEDFMRGGVTMIGCPKLDSVDYAEKLTEIIAGNDLKSLTVTRMEVPCCGGIQRAAEQALKNSGKNIPLKIVTISRDGRILE